MMKPEWAGSLGASRVAALTLGSLILALALATVPLDVLSRQGSPGEPLIGAASFAAVGLVVARRQPRNPICMIAVSLPPAGSAIDPTAPHAVIAVVQALFGLLIALPVCMGVAILKYRLYDIDRIISRTLAYALVTGMLVGVYTGLVLLTTQVFLFHTQVAVAASTLVAAACFNPLRQRVQRVVDRRFNRARYDADQMIAAFAARLKDALDLEAVRNDLVGVVDQALEPEHLQVWVRREPG